ncbi:hypothetical protein BDR26DRAFT_861933 [Obelidium mucronatum]|nr:hypothetical protein BDR26DRAFT_861933 [Obelidium mucronatum]
MAVDPQSVATVWPLVPQGSIYGIGEKNAIAWQNNVTNPLTAPIASLRLELGTGSANSVQTLYTVATVPWPATDCYEWTPNATLTAGATNYTFIFTGLDKNGATIATNYCTWFNIAANGTAGYPVATTCAGISQGNGQAPIAAAPTTTTTTAATVVTTSKSSAAGLVLPAFVLAVAAYIL